MLGGEEFGLDWSELKDLANGENTVTISACVGTGEILTAYTGKPVKQKRTASAFAEAVFVIDMDFPDAATDFVRAEAPPCHVP